MLDLSDDNVRVLIVGHNPGLEELVEVLTGEMHLMPTCSLAYLKLRVDKWSAIGNKIKGQVAEIWRRAISPKAILKCQRLLIILKNKTLIVMTRGGGLSIVDKFDTIFYNLIFNVPKDHLWFQK